MNVPAVAAEKSARQDFVAERVQDAGDVDRLAGGGFINLCRSIDGIDLKRGKTSVRCITGVVPTQRITM